MARHAARKYRSRSHHALLTLGAATLVVAIVLLVGAPMRAAGAGYKVGFGDPLFQSPDPATDEYWLGQAVVSGASIVRINVHWSEVAPLVPPAGFDASDPGAAGYRWATLDAAVKDAVAHGLGVLLTTYSAPRWAEGPERPSGEPRGTWRPNPEALGAFATALATRYDGRYPDPAVSGSVLPRVSDFEVWNEPNLDTYLSPQWEGGTSVGAALYRPLANSFYASVKAVQPTATVIAGSLAPFGDPPGGHRTPPVLFLRDLLCLEGGVLRKIACPERAHFDALSDHPIAVGAPNESATSPLDASTPDLGRLTQVLHKAEAAKTVLPREQRPLWVTEFWYDTNPPDPQGVPLLTQARWYEQDLYSFWRQGASVAITMQIRDAPPGRSYATSNQSGVYFVDGTRKPSQQAFRFPFVAHRTGAFKVGVWGMVPHPGKVSIQVRRDGRWKTLGKVPARPGRPFTAEVQLLRFAKLRGRIGHEVSLPWTL